MFTKTEEISEFGRVLDMTRLRRGRIQIVALVLSLIGVLAFDVPQAGAQSPPIPNGTVMVSVGNGNVQEWNPSQTTAPIATLNTGFTGFTTGSAFDSSGNFYVTDFNGSLVTKFDPTGTTSGGFGSGYSTEPESILFSSAGNVYVGEADGPILELNSTGGFVNSFAAATESRGTDWIDLASDHCTVFYTSEGTHVKRYNTCTPAQLPDFNSIALTGGSAFALRILPSGGVLVANSMQVVQLDPTGLLVQTYTPCECSTLFALSLDPDGTSFWTADIDSAEVFKIDIASGSVLESFNTGTPGLVAGLSVKGEITVGGGGITVSHDTPPGVTTEFDFPPFNFNFKSTPAGTTHNGNSLTITEILVDPTEFSAAGSLFPTAQCIVYSGTGGKCVEFDVKCISNGTTSTDCDTGKYDAEFATSYDVDGDPNAITFPGFLKIKDKACTPTVFGDPNTTNQIDAFFVQRADPTTKGKSGGGGSCWGAVQNLTAANYPGTDLSITKLASPVVKKGAKLTYGIAVLNLGPNPATGVSVIDPIPLPSSMILDSFAVCTTGTGGVKCMTNSSPSGLVPCTQNTLTNVVTCQVGNLLPFSLKTLAAAALQLTFKVNSNVGTTITNTATVKAFNPDTVHTNNNSSTARTKVVAKDK